MASAAKRVARTAVDWSKFSQHVPEAERGAFNLLKGRSNKYLGQLAVLPEELPTIDFAAYKNAVPNLVKEIEALETKYKAAKVPYPDAGQQLQQIEASEKQEKANAVAMVAQSKQKVDNYKKDLKKWDILPPLEQMTGQEWMLYFPGGLIPDTLNKSFLSDRFFARLDDKKNSPWHYYHYGNYRYLSEKSSRGESGAH
jgi:hypothetical protein